MREKSKTGKTGKKCPFASFFGGEGQEPSEPGGQTKLKRFAGEAGLKGLAITAAAVAIGGLLTISALKMAQVRPSPESQETPWLETMAGGKDVGASNKMWLIAGAGTVATMLLAGLALRTTNMETAVRNVAKTLTDDLKKSEARLRAITESAQDAILMMDHKGDISYWNPAAERMLGHSSDEAVGKNLHGLIAPSKFKNAYEVAIPEFLKTGEGAAIGKTSDLEAKTKDGRTINVQLALSALRLENEWHSVGILRDITKRLQNEKDLKAAKEAAEAASLAKNDFLANMSHEIRTPMSAVIGLSDLLMDTTLDEVQKDYTQKIHTAGTALLGVLGDILDYSKIEAGKMRIECAPVRIRQLLDKCQALFGFQAKSKGLRLIFKTDDSIPETLKGDSLRLLQITNNLVSNALKFTSDGEIRVKVATAGETQNTVTVKVEVSDTGIGLSQETQTHIFDPFDQADHSTTRKYGGTGLGLSISKRLAEIMGGAIGVESSVGEGSTFWFTADLQRMAPGEEVKEQPKAPEGSGEGAKVLLVDDNATGRMVTKLFLKKLGIAAEEADGGKTAIELATDNKYDLIFMDVQMPDLSGLEATRRIRLHELESGKKKTPIIALTAGAREQDQRETWEAGMDDHVTKPTDRKRLGEILAKWLPDKKMQA